MKPRINFMTAAPAASRAMYALDTWVRKSSGLDPALLELMRLRASQINGCAYCIDMHSKDALALGENEQRLHVLSAWREAPFYTDRERAALLWTEYVTLVSQDHVPDAIYETVRQQFTEEEMVNLTLAVVAINGWNRFAIAFRSVAGEYQPQQHAMAAKP
jgi:AhpD family alkylhydroperoxidase